VWDDSGEVDNDELEVEDSSDVLEVDASVLWGRGQWTTCLRWTATCSGSGMRGWHALRPGSRWRPTPRPVSRTAGSGGTAVSRVTEGQVLRGFK
jgi:hypothetical protein